MLSEEKAALRRSLLDRRAALPTEERQKTEGRICEILKTAPAILEADLVLLYAAVRGELDLAPLADALLSRGTPIAYPRSERGGVMHFHTVGARSELVPGLYGIPEPPADAPEATVSPRTVCIVPALAYDRDGYRLGYGGGYYDRFMAGFCGKTIGVAPEYAIFDKLPRGEHDLAAFAVATERGIQITEEIHAWS